MERVIRRYANRKLYDPLSRATVTLEDITAMVGGGDDVVVVDAATGQDVTFPILAKALTKLAGKHGYPHAWREALHTLLRQLPRERPGRLWESLKHGGDSVRETIEGTVTRVLRRRDSAIREELTQLRRSVAELGRVVRILRSRIGAEEVDEQ